MRSLRIRLTLLLGALIVGSAALLFLTTFQAAMQNANRMFDYHMEQMAHVIQNSGLEEIPWYSMSNYQANNFDFVIQIWNKQGARVYQTRVYRLLPEQAKLGFSNEFLDSGEWRIFATQNEKQVVQVAQNMSARRDQAISFAIRTLWPVIPISILLFIAAWSVVSASLYPLNRISRDIATRSGESLDPVDMNGIPKEVQPLVQELNLLLSRMDQAFQSQQRFVADAAHELRSPITALKLQVQTLARANDEASRTQGIARLLGGIDRISRLVEQLLALARHEPLSQKFETEPVSLNACLEQAKSDVLPLLIAKDIELRQGGNDLVTVMGEAGSLRILIRNLLDNAARYIPEGGTIQTDLVLEKEAVLLTIQDSGKGIPRSERSRVFDRFFRVPGTEQTGTGLGLAIVKAVAERYKGTVELGTAELGGLMVKVRFPRIK
ncbi:MAG: ATP-binding protein [Burkholderiaceae bacterium]